MQSFYALGAPPPGPCDSGGWGLRPQTPKTPPSPLRISAFAPDSTSAKVAQKKLALFAKVLDQSITKIDQILKGKSMK